MSKHMVGGTLRKVMAAEIKRVLAKHADHPHRIQASATILGITSKTLRQWMGPIEKGGWEELQPNLMEGLQAVLGVQKLKKR